MPAGEGEGPKQVLVVADQQEAAGAVGERLLEALDRRQVEMIGRLA